MEPRKRSQRTEQWRRREAGAASPWLTASHGRAQRRKNLSLALPSATSPLSSPSFPHIYFFFLFLVSFLIGARKRERAGSLGKRVSSACKRESEREREAKLQRLQAAAMQRPERREKVLQLSSTAPVLRGLRPWVWELAHGETEGSSFHPACFYSGGT